MGVNYIEAGQYTSTWYTYTFNTQPEVISFSTLPFPVQIKSRENYNEGVEYLSNHYYIHNNKLNIFDGSINTELSITYPMGLGNITGLIVFNSKLFFIANADDYWY